MAKTIGRYEILEELGRGGMAAVYLAHDPQLGREVALKLMDQQLSGDPAFAARFEREARTVAALEHGAIVSLYDYGESAGWLYLVMRYMKGGSLKEEIARGPLTIERSYNVVRRIGSALDKAHRMGIIHRDLKPGNILLDEERECYLSDFGIVKVAKGDAEYLTETGQTLGTFAYMSPEQVLGRELDGRSDVYALGVVLYEMLTGKHPFGSVATTSGAMAVAHTQEPIPDVTADNPDLPAALAPVIQKALAKDPADRYSAGAEMAAAMRSALTSTDATKAAATGAMTAAAAAAAAKPDEQPVREQPEPAQPVRQQPPAQPPVREQAAQQPAQPPVREPAAQQPVRQQPPASVATPPPDQPAAEEKRKTPGWLVPVAAVAVIACLGIVAVVVFIFPPPETPTPEGPGLTRTAETLALAAEQTQVAVDKTRLAEAETGAEKTRISQELTREAEQNEDAERTRISAELTLAAEQTKVAADKTRLAEADDEAEQARIAAELTRVAVVEEQNREAASVDLDRIANAPAFNPNLDYEIINVWRGEDFRLSVDEGTGLAELQLVDDFDSEQTWRFNMLDDGYFIITNDFFGLGYVLSTFEDSVGPLAFVGEPANHESQQWEIRSEGSWYTISNRENGADLLLSDATGFGNSGIRMAERSATIANEWKIVPLN
jgi:hypothetical protein